MSNQNSVEFQIKEAVQLTGALWSALIEREVGKWQVVVRSYLPKKDHPPLLQFLNTIEVDDWLCDALNAKQNRSVLIANNNKIKGKRLYAYPVNNASRLLLVGADQLDESAQRIWKLVSVGVQSNVMESTASFLVSSVASSLLVPDLNSENPYDLPRALDRALNTFIRLLSVQGGWFAVRRGDSLVVGAQWNAPACTDLVLPIDDTNLLGRISRNLVPIVIRRSDVAWKEIPHKGMKSTTKLWMFIPIVIGQRLIGAVALWRASNVKGEEWQRLLDLATQIAPALETLITFAEMAGHLRRLAMLNDFALTVSTSRNLDQIARRMFAILSRAMGTEMIVLDLLSSNDQILQEYRMSDGNLVSQIRSADEHPVTSLISAGQKVRLNDLKTNFSMPLYNGALSGFYVPLHLRGQPIGILSVESKKENAFNSYDESLITVIASHLASLADYTRLREEAEGRARNLGLIHEVIQQVVGMTDPHEVAERTANLLSRYFAYELTAVFIADEHGELTIGGFGGTSQNVVKRAINSVEYPVIGGITGHVFQTGEGALVNDVLQDARYSPIRGWQAGSELCVAIRDGINILGIIDVESSSRNAFTRNDYLAIESLSGILATVITSADQYGQLQEMIYQLRNTEMELNARMKAQQLAENRLVQAAKLAAVGEMAAGIAHELNNPLTSVTGFAELVMDELPEDSSLRNDMDLVIRESRRARDVVRRLLDFARQSESTRANASLNKVVEDVVALTRHLIHTNGVELHLKLKDDLPWVSMDENQMKQVLLNLVHNALQAMPGGGQMEIITAEQQKAGKSGIMVSVRDSGMGIAPEDQARIFEPFFTTKAGHGGTGLGLSVTYGIVSNHGGEIEMVSQVDHGSRFTVWLPKQ